MTNETAGIDSIFGEAIECASAEERAAYLDRACGGDVELRRRVEKLLDAHYRAGSFLESPAPNLDATVEESVGAGPGTVIGPYQLLEQIGEGGMGLVFVAEQLQPVRRQVALKLIKPGMDTREVIGRFEAERQALALMDHPNIARVLDAGATEQGRPYFVMELVYGIPITQFCDEHRLPLRQRLELFLSVCQAVQHAHTKGIIHRDLKPSNLLVSRHEGTPLVKVIDFGVAKAVGQHLTDTPVYTHFLQLIGTPLYMSPEQAGMSGLDIDTRSDIYALGVLLYELLTGTTPFDPARLRDVGFDEIRRIIREEEPPRPSTRLSESKASLPSIAAQRQTEPAKLAKLVRGELDWIAMKALEKDRNRRYETASAFAADVQRYLNDETVQACPPSAWYRVRTFVRRNKGPVLAVAGVLLALVGGIVGTTIGLLQAESAQLRAEGERRRAEGEKQLAEENFRLAMDAVERYFTTVSEDPKLRSRGLEGLRKELLLAPKEFYQKFIEQHRQDPGLRAELGRAHLRLAVITDALGSKQEAIALNQRALEIIEPLARDRPDDPALQYDLSATHNRLGQLYEATGQPTAAEKAYQQARDFAEQLVRKHPKDPKYQTALGVIHNNLAALYKDRGSSKEAEAAYERARKILEQLTKEAQQRKKEDPWSESWLAMVYFNEGTLYRDTGRLQKAETAFKKARDIQDKLVKRHWDMPEFHQDLADTHHHLGTVYSTTKQLKEAEAAYGQAYTIQRWLVDRHLEVPQYQYDLASTLVNLGTVYLSTGRLKEAEKSFLKVRGLYEKLVQKHGEVLAYQDALAGLLGNLGVLYKETGRFKEAKAAYDEARDRFEKLLGKRPDFLDYAAKLGTAEMNLGNLMLIQGQLQEALTWYGKAISRLETVLRKESRHPLVRENLAYAYWRRSLALLELDRPKEALADRERAIELDDTKNPSNRVARIATLVWLNEHVKALAAVDELAATADTETLYDLACLCAVSQEKAAGHGAQAENYAARAVKLLGQGLAMGLGDLTRLKTDPRLDLVRSRDDFRRLLKELEAEAPLTGKILTGTLAKDDPTDTFAKTLKSHHKVHAVPLEAGQPYLIDLRGTFDTFLRVENSQKQPLLANDDVRPDDLNSRLVFIPPQKDTYRLVVTSFKPGATGPYTLSIQEAVKVGEPTRIKDQLQKTDMKDPRGKFFKLHKVKLAGGSPCTIELASADFDTFLVLLDGAGKQALAENDAIAPGNAHLSRLDFTPKADAAFTVAVTSFGRGETGAYTLTVQQYEAAKDKKNLRLRDGK
jgi:serine/threonine protein kinase/tetratricopeptide (TPR) repeat protein